MLRPGEETPMERVAGERAGESKRPGRFKWGFLSSAGVILFLLVIGQAVGAMLSQYPPAQALLQLLKQRPVGPVLSAMNVPDWLFTAFLPCVLVYVALAWASIRRFLLAMQTGVALVTLTTLAIVGGVLVPQIENFEDPQERISDENYETNYSAFRWAEGYFLYHLVRPYGIGMPEVVIPEVALEGLERYGRVYGEGEAKNRRKMMKAAFAGRSKSAEIGEFIERNDAVFRKAFDVCTFLELNRTYKSNWFTTLLGVLGAALLTNLLRGNPRKLFTLKKIGFAGAHVGMLTILVGGFVSKMFTDRGRVDLFLGEGSKDTYSSFYDPAKPVRMPFAVRLDHFARKEWKALEVTFLNEPFSSRPPRWTVWEGRTIPLDFVLDETVGEEGEWVPRVELRVRELHDRAEVGRPTVREGSPGDDGGLLPIVELEVPNVEPAHAHGQGAHAMDDTRLVHLSPQFPGRAYRDPDGAFRLAVAHGGDPLEVFPAVPDLELGTLDIQVLGAEDARPIPVRVRLGETVPLKRGFSVTFVDATTDFQMRADREAVQEGAQDPRPLAERPEGFAAIWIDIHPPGGAPPERRIVIEVLDAVEYGLQENYENKEVVARLRWDRWASPGPPRFVLGYGSSEPGGNGPGAGESGGAVLLGEDGARTEVAAGDRLPLPGVNATVLSQLFERARFDKNLEFVENDRRSDGWDATFYEKEPRGLVLDVVHNPGTDEELIETVRMATTQAAQSNMWWSGDGRFVVEFLENTEGFPYDWRSVLSIIERDAEGHPYTVDVGSEKEREIRVNDYFHYNTSWWPGNGYRFFQTNAEATMPMYSGIGVVYDPGIPIVMFGMWIVIAATAAAFLLRPILKRRTA